MDRTTNWDDIVTGGELLAARKKRGPEYVEEKFQFVEEADRLKEGWKRVKVLGKGKYVRMRREKDIGSAFEDKVWMLFARMGFSHLNATAKFTLHFGRSGHQQIDIFAVDSECIVIVECKAAAEKCLKTYKKEIEALGGQKKELEEAARVKFPGRRVKFIWATQNLYKSKADEARLSDYGILHFNEEAIAYYNDLATHIGSSAKYQLFARLFAEERIVGFDNKVYAIRSILGNVKCYTFAIEPSRLLKLGYVLHHHSANEDMMPAYQRLIKKSRLRQIKEFIEQGGYFANSLIVSVCTRGRPMRFDVRDSQIPNANSSIGILHLPEIYRSVYIIDGQHRLYAYSDSTLADKHTIPVVAFENLDKREQLRLFMDINENQKSVPKSLRATLSSAMLWDSEDPEERRLAIASQVAQRLEDDASSVLKGRIIVGENEQSSMRKVTINAIQDALKRSGFFTKFLKVKGDWVADRIGMFDFDNNDKTFDYLFSFFILCFDQIKERCPSAWQMTDEQHTILITNRGIQAVIRLVGDIVSYLHEKKIIGDPRTMEVEDLAERVIEYLEPWFFYVNNIKEQDRKSLRVNLGAKADNIFLHEFQKAVRGKYKDFNPEGLSDYLLNETRQYNDETLSNIQKIQEVVLNLFDEKLWNNITADQQLKAFPKKTYQRLTQVIGEYNYGHDVDDGDFRMFVTLGELQNLALDPKYWAAFENVLSDPSVKRTASKKKKTAWMGMVDSVAKRLEKKTYSVPASVAQAVARIYEWLVGE